ncbi:MAG: glyoxylate/hydroxypyruvate reductase A [Pseudomonadota bacterium]
MGILLLAPDRDLRGLVQQLHRQAPDLALYLWPQTQPHPDIDFALCWNPPAGVIEQFSSLKAVTSLGAGVDALLDPAVVPSHLPIGRISGPELALDMARWLIAQITSHWLQLDQFRQQQIDKDCRTWAPTEAPLIGLLGIATIGASCARQFQSLGLRVEGWNRSGHGPSQVPMHLGAQGLHDLAARADYLICLLPLTNSTRGILDRSLFKAMRPGSVLINVGRGQHLVEADLLTALDAGQPALAILDVFQQEPLPTGHPFWSHPRVRVSPHCAAISQDEEVARLLLDSYRRVQAGELPLGAIDRQAGY